MSTTRPSRLLQVLVVDDDPMVANVVSSILEDRGHTVSIASSAFEALQQRVHDVAIVDLHLPDTSGLDVLESLRDRGDDCALLLMTGHCTRGARARAEQLGVPTVIQKPFGVIGLVNTVEMAGSALIHSERSVA